MAKIEIELPDGWELHEVVAHKALGDGRLLHAHAYPGKTWGAGYVRSADGNYTVVDGCDSTDGSESTLLSVASACEAYAQREVAMATAGATGVDADGREV